MNVLEENRTPSDSEPIKTRYCGHAAALAAWPVWRVDQTEFTALKPWYIAKDHGFLWGAESLDHADVCGAEQLALSMIYDATNDRKLALKTYQHFARHVVAHFGFVWTMYRSEVVGIAQAIAENEEVSR